jgi:hypothetical protein
MKERALGLTHNMVSMFRYVVAFVAATTIIAAGSFGSTLLAHAAR